MIIENQFGGVDLLATAKAMLVRIENLEKEVFAPVKKSSGVDGDAGDWTKTGDGTTYPAVPTQAEADAVAAEAKAEEFNETVYYEDGSSAYGPKPIPRVNEHGSPAKV